MTPNFRLALIVLAILAVGGWLFNEFVNILLEQSVIHAVAPTKMRRPLHPDISHCFDHRDLWDCIRHKEE